MNYDLALMALEGMTRAPLHVSSTDGEIVIEGSGATFKELARLCLLLGGTQTADDAFELAPGTHVSEDSPRVHLRLIAE
jgi:formate-dependent phosphoribosylglycinamide formyltransferase (GAR transformylase)